MTDLLTADELHAMNVTAQLVNALHNIVGQGPSREDDLTELVGHVHNIQHAVMGQAAARAYPERFRLLGEDHTGRDVDDVALPTFLEPQLPLGHFLDGSQEAVMHLADERGMALCTGRPFDALQAAVPVPTCAACMSADQTPTRNAGQEAQEAAQARFQATLAPAALPTDGACKALPHPGAYGHSWLTIDDVYGGTHRECHRCGHVDGR
jgi:hypothetical protein